MNESQIQIVTLTIGLHCKDWDIKARSTFSCALVRFSYPSTPHFQKMNFTKFSYIFVGLIGIILADDSYYSYWKPQTSEVDLNHEAYQSLQVVHDRQSSAAPAPLVKFTKSIRSRQFETGTIPVSLPKYIFSFTFSIVTFSVGSWYNCRCWDSGHSPKYCAGRNQSIE